MKLSEFSPAARKLGPAAQTELALPGDQDVVSRFRAHVREHPDRPAVHDGERSITYGELERRALRLARFLSELGVDRELPVGLLLERGIFFPTAIMGVLAAGSAYCPISPAVPRPRMALMLRRAGCKVLLSEKALSREAVRLSYEVPGLDDVVLLDHMGPGLCPDEAGVLMNEELWDHLALEGGDEIQASGWRSMYTGEFLSRQVMDQYAANALAKTRPFLGPRSRVLEVGAASGITAFALAPHCASYLATDLSRSICQFLLRRAHQRGLTNLNARRLSAEHIDALEPGFDLIVINSVIQGFPGYNYLAGVLDKAMGLLAPDGALFLGQVWDLARHDELERSLLEFARSRPGAGARTLTELVEELFVPREFFADWAARSGMGLRLSFSDIDADERDLAGYAYDLLITRDPSARPGAPGKRQRGREEIKAAGDGPAPAGPGPRDLSHIIFTSGTTGVPKAVACEHHAVVNMADGISRRLLPPDDKGAIRFSGTMPFHFDGSLAPLFVALLHGHCFYIVPDQSILSPDGFAEFLRAHRIDMTDATPTLFAVLVEECARRGQPAGPAHILLAGEALPRELLSRFFAVPGHESCLVTNGYGPTENTVCATLFTMNSESWRMYPRVPIGTPIEGVETLLLDEAGQQTPDGVPGELCLAGVSLARGYLGDPKATAKVFCPHPFRPGRRIYRTGDVCRRRPDDGLLEFLHRNDGQVKVRGNRLELGEVEAALLECPQVTSAVAAAGDWLGDGDTSLAAYVVTQDELDPGSLRERLSSMLPDYMVPAFFVRIESVPTTITGKVDRSALPAPAAASAAPAADHEPSPPQGGIELAVAEAWSRLGLVSQDAEANFFNCGGHSVLAVRLAAILKEELGASISLSQLFATPTIRGLAAHIDAGRQSPEWSSLVPVRTAGTRPPMLCFHPAGGNVLCYRDLAEELGPDQPVYMLQAYGLMEGQQPAETVEEMVEGYMADVLAALPRGPVALAGWSFGAVLAFEAAHQLLDRGRQVTGLIILDGVAQAHRAKWVDPEDEAAFLVMAFSEVMPLDLETMRSMDTEARVDYLVAQGKHHGVFPRGFSRDQMLRMLALARANARAAFSYRPRPLDMPGLLVRPRGISRGVPYIDNDPEQGWGPVVTGGLTLKWVDGIHETMIIYPAIAKVAVHIREHLGLNGREDG